MTESDLALAQRFNAIIYAFNTSIPSSLQKAADTSQVPVRPFNVIYHLIDDLKQEISLRLPPANLEAKFYILQLTLSRGKKWRSVEFTREEGQG